MVKWLSKPVRVFLLQLGISVFVAAFVLVLTQDILFEFPPLKNAELSLYDLRLRYRGISSFASSKSRVVIVSISQESFRSLPARWPWPMSYYTRLVKNLQRAGAKVIGLDLLLAPTYKPDRNEEDEFKRAVRDAGNVVLAGKIRTEETAYTVFESKPIFGNRFIDSNSSFGIVYLPEDNDDVRRRYMPFVDDQDQQTLLPTFSMAVLNVFYHCPPASIAEVTENGFRCYGKQIPRYDDISFLINYYGTAETFPRVDFANVIDDETFSMVEEIEYGQETNTFDDSSDGLLVKNVFRDKIVLIGSTEPEDKDLFLTPIGKEKQENDLMYGVEIHANVIQSILDNNFIPPQPFSITLLTVFGLSLFTFVFIAALKTIRIKHGALIDILGVALVLSMLFIIYTASLKLFVDHNYLVHMTSAFLAVIVSYVGSIVYYYAVERRQKFLIKGMFSQYVNPNVVDELVAHPEKLRLGGERKELTVFFSDIENFTRISERMSPENLVTVLNEYLEALSAIILTNDGTLDKYEGDAVVAFWGAPIPQTDHALKACRAAVHIQDTLRGLRELWKNEGKPDLQTRIGINTSEVIVGNMGGVNRFDYTVIGDGVNLGSRLESANKQYRTNIMISENTYQHVKDKVFARELDLLIVSGKTEPIRVYELVGMIDRGIGPEKQKFIGLYSQALQSYRLRRWESAIRGFEQALEIVPEDFPAQLYIERSHMYRKSPPPPEWNGVFILQTK